MANNMRCELCKRRMVCFLGGIRHCGNAHVWIPKRWRRKR